MGATYRLADLGLAASASAGVVKAREVRALDEADAILGAARERAAAILADSEAVYQTRREEGYAEGLAAAARDALAQLLAEQSALDAAVRGLEGRLAGLVVACVGGIIGQIDDATVAERLALTALTKMRREQRAQLFVPLALVEPMRERVGAILATFPEVELIDVVGDPALSPPSVVLQSSLGRVRCALDDALDTLDRTIREVLGDTATVESVVPGAIEVHPAAAGEDEG